MADVCLTAAAVLSPLSPNESRKRRHGSSGVQGTWFKRHRTGHGFARRLLHLRGFSIDVRQAEELARFIDQFPPEMEKVRPREIRPSPRGIETPRPRDPGNMSSHPVFRDRTSDLSRGDRLSPPSGRIPHPGEVR